MIIKVVDVNGVKNFNNSIKDGSWLVWYYADWCGHCKAMENEWENLALLDDHSATFVDLLPADHSHRIYSLVAALAEARKSAHPLMFGPCYSRHSL